jgi:hypothetical protein
VFIGSVNNTSDKLFTGVNNTNDILQPVLLLQTKIKEVLRRENQGLKV